MELKEQIKELLKENLSVKVSKNKKDVFKFWDIQICFDEEEILRVWVKEEFSTKWFKK